TPSVLLAATLSEVPPGGATLTTVTADVPAAVAGMPVTVYTRLCATGRLPVVEIAPLALAAPQVAVLAGAAAQFQDAVPVTPARVWVMTAPTTSIGPVLVTV